MATEQDNGLWGDPEAAGAAQASLAMEPVVGSYLSDVFSGRKLLQGLSSLSVPYDPGKSFAANALNPQGLQAATDLALGFSGGGLHFKTHHGTGANQPFREFADEFMGTGEGTQYEGWGHYVAERPGIAESYRNISGGDFKVPVDKDGVPLNYNQVAEKYFEPGSIVPSYGGTFDRVIKFNKEEPGQPWSVTVRQVGLDQKKMVEKYGNRKLDWQEELKFQHARDTGWTSEPDLWTDIGKERTHATYPTPSYIESMGIDRNWDMGHRGALLDINVIPEKHEFLDLNLPWKYQDSVVKERLEKAYLDPKNLDPLHQIIRQDTYIPGTEDFSSVPDNVIHEHMTGRDLYNSWVRQRSYEMAKDVRPYETEDNLLWYSQDYTDAAKEVVSKEIDKAGVPGFKFLDRPSRKIGPTLEHEDNFAGMPGGISLDHILRENSSPKIFDVGDLVKLKADLFRNYAFRAEASGYNYASTESAKLYHRVANWLEKEHAAGRFSLGDAGRTRNFVVVNPKNLEIKTWNGRPMEVVDHDPYAVEGTK